MRSKNTVLILTQQLDFHADPVVRELNERHVPVFRFDTSDFPLRSTLSVRSEGGNWDGILEYANRRVHLDQIRSVWYRRPMPFEFDAVLSEREREFASAETRKAFGGILRGLDCLWVNHPEHLVTANYKPLQLKLATTYGLQIPPTLITNNPKEVNLFFEQCKEEMIYKTLDIPTVFQDGDVKGIFTTLVTRKDLEEINLIRHNPCLFQQYVPKKVELRITIIGTHVFCAEIHSQHSERTTVDWRRSYDDLQYGIHELPEAIREKCLSIVRHFGLSFAAIDMILTPDDQYVFLEVNPNGQWGWIEQETGLPICKTLVDFLVGDTI